DRVGDAAAAGRRGDRRARVGDRPDGPRPARPLRDRPHRPGGADAARAPATDRRRAGGRGGMTPVRDRGPRAVRRAALMVELERHLAFELRARFIALLEARERLRLTRADLDRYRQTVRVSETRAREGDISRAELDKIGLEQRGFEREASEAEGDRREAVAGLVPLLGVDAA